MAVPVTPPLLIANAARGERDRRSVRRWRSLKFVGKPIGAHGHRRPAFRTHTVNIILAAHVVRSGGEINPLAVARPRVELLHSVIERQSLQLARNQREDVDVASARARGYEGELRAIGRIKRSRLFGRMRHENMRFAPGRGSDPNVAARHKSNLGASGAQRGLREVGSACRAGENGHERKSCQNSHD